MDGKARVAEGEEVLVEIHMLIKVRGAARW